MITMSFPQWTKYLSHWCHLRGIHCAHRRDGIPRQGLTDPREFCELVRDLRKGPLAAALDEKEQDLIRYAEGLEAELAAAAKGAA